MLFHFTHPESGDYWCAEYDNYDAAYAANKGDGFINIFTDDEWERMNKDGAKR